MTPERLSTFIFRDLTHADAARMGHIAWIESADPVAALRQMHRAVASAPFNCAVWANAGDFIPAGTRDTIRVWKDMVARVRPVDTYHEEKNLSGTLARNALKNTFQVAAAKILEARPLPQDLRRQQEGLDVLEPYSMWLLDQIIAAINPKHVLPDIRFGNQTQTIDTTLAHTDGGDQDYRILQAIESATTYIIDNRDAAPFTDDNKFSLADKDGIVFWRVPANSMTLVTSKRHHCQPILHDFPWFPADREQQYRSVLAYDVYGPRPTG